MNVLCPHCKLVVTVAGEPGDGATTLCESCGGRLLVPSSRLAANVVIGGHFVIARELARGGMGTVYLAAELGSQRPVAIKILHEHYSRDPSFIDEFFREARAVAQINHPGIVQAYAVGREDSLYYFAMEYVKGHTLKEILAEAGRLPPERALDIVREVNLSLHFAWITQKLIHRDIKPDNIMVTQSGLVILADLGLARKATDLLQTGGRHDDEVAGTPQYMSPEQILLKPMDCRSDMYSLGATLYHALTGRFPYVGTTLAQMAMKHLTEPLVPPLELAPQVSPALSRLVEIMMAKRPEHRYPGGDELADDIDRVTRGEFPQFPISPDSQSPLEIPDAGGTEAARLDSADTRKSLRLTTTMLLPKPGLPAAAPLRLTRT